MSQHFNETRKDQLIEEFKAVANGTEQLLRHVAVEGGAEAHALRANVEQNLANAKNRLHSLQYAATQKTRAAARSTDEYVHGHPWQAMGIAAGFGAIASVATYLVLNRR